MQVPLSFMLRIVLYCVVEFCRFLCEFSATVNTIAKRSRKTVPKGNMHSYTRTRECVAEETREANSLLQVVPGFTRNEEDGSDLLPKIMLRWNRLSGMS